MTTRMTIKAATKEDETMTTHEIHPTQMTVVARDEHGEAYDLNAKGAPCETYDHLCEFIRESRRQGFFGGDVEAALLAEAREVWARPNPPVAAEVARLLGREEE